MNELKLKKIFAESFEIDPELVPELEYQSIPAWDSIGHMRLVAAIDNTFDIMMDTDDVIDMSSYTKAKEILKKYGVNFE